MARLARYQSFAGIDFDANMRAVLDHLATYLDNPAICNPFWQRFKDRLALAETTDRPVTDRLLLMHSHVYYMQELFEDQDDQAALDALAKLEDECF